MAVDKKIDYVEQDGSLNFIKNSESVTVPKKFKARKNAPATKLAYITDAEAKMLKKMKKGTPHKGPKGIPSYDSFGSIDKDTGKDTGRAGEDVSSAERGDFRGFEGSRNLPPGVQPKPSDEAQALRNQFIAAGGGQRVNPGFFDSRNVVSPAELARARAFNPDAFSAGRRGGIMDLFTGGGFLGNIIRGIGQKFGLGKRFDEPTYDMSRFSNLGLFSPSINPTFQNDLGNEFALANTTNQIPVVIDNDMSLVPDRGLTVAPGDGIMTIPTDVDTTQDQSMDDFYKDAMASSDIAPQFQNLVTRTGGLQDPVTTKLNEQKNKIEAIQKSDAYEYLSNAQKEQLQKDLNKIIQDLNLKQVASSIDT